MRKTTLSLVAILATTAVASAAYAWELRPYKSLPIGGTGSAFNQESGILYTSAGYTIYAYDVYQHAALPPIEMDDSGIGPMSVNPVSNTIFFTNMSGTYVLHGDTQEVEGFGGGQANSLIRVLVNRTTNTMFAMYLKSDGPPQDPVRYLTLATFEADTLAPLTSTLWWNHQYHVGGFAIDERNNQVFVHLPSSNAIQVLDGATLELITTIEGDIVDGPLSGQVMPFDPVSRRLYAYRHYPQTDDVTVIDVDEQTVLGTVDIPSVRDIAIDKRRGLAYVTSFENAELYKIDRYGQLSGSTTVSPTGSVSGVPVVQWRTGSVYVPAWDEEYQGIAVIRRGRIIQRVDLQLSPNQIYAPRWSRRAYAVGQGNTSRELYARWPIFSPHISTADTGDDGTAHIQER